jgi:hypothetical protein
MRRLVVGCALVVAIVSASVSPVAAELGGSDTRPCVTKREYRAVKVGMAMERVHRIFDTDGRLDSRHDGYTFRSYNACSGFLDWQLRFYDGRLDGKTLGP